MSSLIDLYTLGEEKVFAKAIKSNQTCCFTVLELLKLETMTKWKTKVCYLPIYVASE